MHYISISKHKSLKLIKLSRSVRYIWSVFISLFLIFSILISLFVIYQKKDTLYKIGYFASHVSRYFIHGVNFLDNNLNNFDRININSLKYIKREDVIRMIDESLTSDTSESALLMIYNKILTIPFVKTVTIKRNINRDLLVSIKEINVVGVIKDKDQNSFLIGDNGKYVEQRSSINTNISFPSILNLDIEDIDNYVKLYQFLKKCNTITDNIKEYVNISDRRWNIVLQNNTVIMLPSEISDEFIENLCLLDSTTLNFTKRDDILYLDTRIPGRFYYKNKNI